MRKRIVLSAILVSLMLVAASAWAGEEGIIDSVVKVCQQEIESYCSQVTLGEGRLLACFYAHGDKLSSRCEFALYDAAAELEQFAAALTHLASECRDDLRKYCSEVQFGEGRVGSCLLEHEGDVTEACRQAIDDVELEVVE